MVELTIPEQIALWDKINRDMGYLGSEPEPELVRIIGDRESKLRQALDIGCGNGRHLVWLAKADWRVSGLDWSKEAVYRTKDALAMMGLIGTVVRGDMRKPPFTAGQFKLVIATRVLQHGHLKDFQRVLHEVREILSIGGQFIFNVPTSRNAPLEEIQARWVEKNTVILARGREAFIPHHFFSDEEMEQEIKGWRKAEVVKTVAPLPPGRGPLYDGHLNEWYWVTLTR